MFWKRKKIHQKFTKTHYFLIMVPKVFLLTFLLMSGCDDFDPNFDDPPIQVLRIAPTGRKGERALTEDYLGFAIDSSLVFGGHWWGAQSQMSQGLGEEVADPLDLSNRDLLAWSKLLGPTLYRIGGSQADHLYYDLTESNESLARTPIPEGYELILNDQRWQEIIDFVRFSKSELVFTINAGPGPRIQSTDQRSWDPANARSLLEHATARQDPVRFWEFGNEPNIFFFLYGWEWQVGGWQYAQDYERLVELARAMGSPAPVLGPSSAFWPLWGEGLGVLQDFIHGLETPPPGVVFHYYPQQSTRGFFRSRTATPSTLLEEAHLDDVLSHLSFIRSSLTQRGFESPVILGETGHAQFGGQPGLSDSYLSSLWWLDLLSLMAHQGVRHIWRQALVGSDYGLLDQETFEPRPDYWISLLWRTHVDGYPRGWKTLESNVPSLQDGLRLYGFSSEEGEILVLINLNQGKALALQLPWDYQSPWEVIRISTEDPLSGALSINGRIPDAGWPWTEGIWETGGDTKSMVLSPLSMALVKFRAGSWDVE